MGAMASEKTSIEGGESFHLREEQNPYIDHFGAKKSKIEPENTCIRNLNS